MHFYSGIDSRYARIYRGPAQQGALPMVDHRRMHAEPARQFRDRLLALQRLKGDAGFEIRLVLLALRHLGSPLSKISRPQTVASVTVKLSGG